MQITRESDYAISCILYMSKEPRKVFVISEIAKPQYIPESFLSKILQKLVHGGLVKSIRGTRGGYLLAKQPRDINLFDVIEVIEGSLAMNLCVENKSKCIIANRCPVYTIWMEIKCEVEKKLKECNFEQLIYRENDNLIMN
ncbi:Transcriptional regulator, Rrf2 [Candidatus Magnetoovum chiemensis]|nr:Transcriptional regulator, Rrf2 [Candidatus Magnetoovum chiemensis]